MDATVQAFREANKRGAILERRRCRLVCTSVLRFPLALVMAVLVLAATTGVAIFHGQYYTDWLLRLMLYNIVPSANSTEVESIFDAPLGGRTHQKVDNGSYTATVMDGVCTKEVARARTATTHVLMP